MVRASRTWLLKIPEVLSVRSGRNLDPESQWQFFYSFEADSLEKAQPRQGRRVPPEIRRKPCQAAHERPLRDDLRARPLPRPEILVKPGTGMGSEIGTIRA